MPDRLSPQWGKIWVILFFFLFLFIHCGKSDHPFSLSEPSDGGPAPAGGDGAGPSVGGECVLQFKALIQLKASANPVGASGPFEILDANPFNIEAPIPIRVNGNQLILEGNSFPQIFFRPPETPADVRIAAVPDTVSVGTYDPETGEINFPDFSFFLQIVKKGGTDTFIPGEKILPKVDLSTGSLTVNGNLNPITETGKPLDKEDRSLVLVTGLTLPVDFDPLTPLNTIIGGGALTARFEGILDQLPENCQEGAGGFDGPVPGLPGIDIQIEHQSMADKIDFGNSTVVLRKLDGKVDLDCSQSEYRGLLSRKVTLVNRGTQSRKIRLAQPKDLDTDKRSPLCSGSGEFVRGSITTQGSAECETFFVGGKEFTAGDCTLPADPNASISFPLMYLPFNYVQPEAGAEPVVDQGKFDLVFDNDITYGIRLQGRSVPDVGDTFSVAKLKEGDILAKEIPNHGLIKISLESTTLEPYVQKMVLKNTGVDAWDHIQFQMEDGRFFSVNLTEGTTLPAGTAEGPAALEFELLFEPFAVGNFFSDVMTITLVREGSQTAQNPQGVQAKLTFNLLGTVGVPPLQGRWEFHFDFFTALIDHVALTEPIESTDYRARPDLAPTPLTLIFEDTDEEGVQNVSIEFNKVDILDPAFPQSGLKKLLRIFNARASRREDGVPYQPSDTEDDCNEPADIHLPYQKGDCSFFYFNFEETEPGLYDDESGHLTLPGIEMEMINPYHADIFGIWPASNPNGNPDYVLKIPFYISFSTHTLDRLVLKENGLPPLDLVSDDRISPAGLIVRDKRLGMECPEDYLQGDHPRLKCYVTGDEKYMIGKALTIREGTTDQYYVNLVGVTRMPPGNTDPDIPWFLGDNGGSRMYIAIQGRLCPEGSACPFDL